VTDTTRERLHTIISNLSAGGNTNLGAGLQEGIATLLANRKDGNLGKVILISDGLANRGITHPDALGKIASLAPEEACMVSTVGVGNDFNPQLMATIANRGAGNFYYLEDAQSFAEFFNKEFHYSRTVAAYGIEIKVPLSKDVSLLKAAGYPITISKDYAIFRPGDLLTGETRKLFLTFKLPTDSEETYELSGITARYLHQGCPYMATLTETFQIAYVNDPNEALVSIAPREWEEKVFRDDFSVLQENVAMSLRNRDQEGALQQIDQYYTQQQLLNARIGSAKVATHLNEELDNLRDQVRQTFRGSPQEVEEQLKQADIMYINGSFQAPRAIMRK
jgi:Ca-activated chloride channel family protein